MISVFLELPRVPVKKMHFVVDQLKPKEKVQKVVMWVNIRSENKGVLSVYLPF